jgi:large subunit ribosomal protein L10
MKELTSNLKPQMLEKVETVEEIKSRLAKANAFYVAKYDGLTVAHLSKLRKDLRATNSEFTVFKNTMFRLAIKDTDYAKSFDGLLKGANAIAFSYSDGSSTAKALFDFAGTNDKLSIKGCLFDNQFFGPDKISIIKDLPSKTTLLSMLASVLNEPMAKLARTLDALRETKESGN